jgi:subtilisin family serine protease
MRTRKTQIISVLSVLLILAISAVGVTAAALAAVTGEELADICGPLYGGVFGVPNSEPLGPCQWNMALVNASDSGSYALATGKGIKVGMIDSGVDFTHPDIAPNLDAAEAADQ